MKKLLLLCSLFVFTCSTDNDSTPEPEDFNRSYVGQFEINNVGGDNFWCYETSGTINIYHTKVGLGAYDDDWYFRNARLTPQGSCSEGRFYSYDNSTSQSGAFTFGEGYNENQIFWNNIYVGGFKQLGAIDEDYKMYCEVTSFESSDLSAVSNNIQGVIKQYTRFENGIMTIGTFTATLEND